jgi:monofunctional biosynthetic peptidoglycan transglycosylase
MSTRASRHLARRRDQNRSRAAAKQRGLFRRTARGALRLSLLGLAAPLLLALPFRWLDPPSSSIMLQRSFAARTQNRPEPRFEWLDARQISPHLAVAVITAEDQKFASHFGFDFDAIADAATERRKRRRGASTISQQVAKNLFLWPGRSLARKAIEAYFTLVIEGVWPKARILEIYLNIAEFGPNVFGAGAASRVHFGKPASQLSPEEAALLAAVLPNPARLSASQPSDYVRERSEEIAAASIQLGGLDALRGL